MQNDERTNGLPLSEKQGVGSSILPLATVKQKKFNILILNIKILHIQTLNQ